MIAKRMLRISCMLGAAFFITLAGVAAVTINEPIPGYATGKVERGIYLRTRPICITHDVDFQGARVFFWLPHGMPAVVTVSGARPWKVSNLNAWFSDLSAVDHWYSQSSVDVQRYCAGLRPAFTVGSGNA